MSMAASLPNPDNIKRINVAISPGNVASIQLVMKNEGVSLTEAVRRLITYGAFIYEAVKVDGEDCLLRKGNVTREVVLIR